ncbi:hypothetical protein CF319_g9093 [Tilletia indica]|nr:hypothetical protein CF319_g9093 [Tilletia indica]
MAPTSKEKEAPASASSSAAAAAQVSPAAPSDQPTMADLYQAIMSIRHQVGAMDQKMETVEFEVASQKLRLDSLTSGVGKTTYDTSFKTPSSQVMVEGNTQAPLRHLGQGFVSPAQYGLQAGSQGGPFGRSPEFQQIAPRPNRGRVSFGVSGFPLPPQAASPIRRQGGGTAANEFRSTSTPYKSVPRDSDPVMVSVKSDLLEVHRDYTRSIHPDWSEDQVEKEANHKAADDYLALRKRTIEDALTGNTPKASGHHNHDGRPVRRVNWDMVKIMTKLNWTNWSDWRSAMYSLLGTVPGAIGILEGMIYGPKYLDPDDMSSHPDYDEALDLELGQVIHSSIDLDVKSLLLKPNSEQELRGSIFYRELRDWLVPTAGYAGFKLLGKLGKQRQREDESIRAYGERHRKLYLDLQAAGDPLEQRKQIAFLLMGLRPKFSNVRDNVVSRTTSGELLTFEKVLRILAEAEHSFAAFEDRRPGFSGRSVPPLSRPSAHVAEDDYEDEGVDGDEEEDVQALAAQIARQIMDRRREQGGYKRRPFNKACFCCKKIGHRAEDCPGVDDETKVPAPRALATTDSSSAHPLPHTCGKDEARASFAQVPSLGAFEAQAWEDELDALPAALNVVTHDE